MSWAFVVALNIFFGTAVAVFWIKYFGSRKTKPLNRRVGYHRDEIEIDAADVPPFKPTWRNAR